MSNGTSAGNIVTEVPGTYAARTWIDIEKADFFGVIADDQLDAIVAANWFNNVDDNLVQINAWLNGTGQAAHIRAAEATIGTVNFTALTATSAAIGGGAIADANSAADDVVVGSLAATGRGITILSTSVAQLVFADTAATITGSVSYTHASDTMAFGIAGAAVLDLTATVLAPHVNGAITLGSGSLKYAAAHVTAVTAYSSLTIGDATGSPVLNLDRDSAGSTNVDFRSEGTSQWKLHHKSDSNLSLDRYVAGVLADSLLINNATGAMTVAFGATLSNGLTVSSKATFNNNLEVKGSASEFSHDDALVSVGSGNNSGTVSINGATTNLSLMDGTTGYSFNNDSNLSISYYLANVFQHSISYANTGEVTMPWSLVVGSATESAPILGISKDTSGAGSLIFYNESVQRWAFICDDNENLLFKRYDGGGSELSSVTFTNSTGLWSLPNDVTLTGSGRTLTVGNNTGAATFSISKTTGTNALISFFSNAVLRWGIKVNTSQNLLFERYDSGGSLTDSTTVSATDGTWVFPAAIAWSGVSNRFHAGSGVPSAGLGSNGDLYWRTGGATSTCLYFKSGGSWTALAT